MTKSKNSKGSKEIEATEALEEETSLPSESKEEVAELETSDGPNSDNPDDAENADRDIIELEEPEPREEETPTETPDTSAVSEAPQPERQVIVQKTGFLAALSAGVLAAGAGFLGAQYSSQSWPFEPGPSSDPLAVAQAAQDQAEALSARLDSVETTMSEQQTPPPAPDLTPLESRITELSDSIASIEERLTDLEARPATGAPAQPVDLSGVEAELESLRGQMSELVAEANVAEATAAAAAQAQLARAAMAKVSASLETGVPFASALADVASASDVTIPDALSSVADEGVPTLASLQDSFDPVARDALAAARAASSLEDGDMSSRLTSFLRARTGARSVEPREGDDPDAVLSRVGASIRSGNIADALAEAEALPEEARAAMTQWLQQAETRQSALSAAQELSQELNSN